MSRNLGPGIERFTTKSNVEGGAPGESYWFWCVGCDTNHRFVTKNPEGGSGPCWTVDGNMDKPTFSPSLLCNRDLTPEHKAAGGHRCHLFLRAGMLQYLNDCTHDLSGKTVPVECLGNA